MSLRTTSKPLSCVIFGDFENVKFELLRLVRAKKIVYGHAVWHLPEEAGKEGHAHVWLDPNGQIEPLSLSDGFMGPVFGKTAKGQHVGKWLIQSVVDWLDYIEHKDEEYTHHYDLRKDVWSTDFVLLEQDIQSKEKSPPPKNRAKAIRLMRNMAEKGVPYDRCSYLAMERGLNRSEAREAYFTRKRELDADARATNKEDADRLLVIGEGLVLKELTRFVDERRATVFMKSNGVVEDAEYTDMNEDKMMQEKELEYSSDVPAGLPDFRHVKISDAPPLVDFFVDRFKVSRRRGELHSWRLLVDFVGDKENPLHYALRKIPNFAATYMYPPPIINNKAA